LEISRQCWCRGSKLDYSSSCLSVYIWKCYVSVGAGEESLTTSSRRGVYIWRFYVSVEAEEANFTILPHVSGLYLEILRQCWGRGSKLDYSSSRLSVYIWRFYVSVGVGEASLTILLHVSVSIFEDFTSVLG
jgi:hypothetical protein